MDREGDGGRGMDAEGFREGRRGGKRKGNGKGMKKRGREGGWARET